MGNDIFPSEEMQVQVQLENGKWYNLGVAKGVKIKMNQRELLPSFETDVMLLTFMYSLNPIARRKKTKISLAFYAIQQDAKERNKLERFWRRWCQ